MKSTVSFLLNGENVVVENPDPVKSLAKFLRHDAKLKGTKVSCAQGGCGACIVLVSGQPVNSCLRPLCAVDGAEIVTVEGLQSGLGCGAKGGGRALHPVQKQLVKHNASQCGFCTPGFAMSMCGLLAKSPNPSPQEVEDQFDGNICRCTGYRPILDAFQELASSSPSPSLSSSTPPRSSCPPSVLDIEELGLALQQGGRLGPLPPVDAPEANTSPSKAAGNAHACVGGKMVARQSLICSKGGVTWAAPSSLEEAVALLKAYEYGASEDHGVRMVVGNTSVGIYAPPAARLLLNLSHVPELSAVQVDATEITFGAAVTISHFIEVLQENKNLSSSFEPLLHHLQQVANHPVRNEASVCGNLVVARDHPDFVSDLATVLAGARATLLLTHVAADSDSTQESETDVLSFLGIDGRGILVRGLRLPTAVTSEKLLIYRMAQRRVNAKAIVNAAFSFSLHPATGAIESPPLIVFGGIVPHAVRAVKTEQFLCGKNPLHPDVIPGALAVLNAELVPSPSFPKASYRASLSSSFLYKALLSLLPTDKLPSDLLSTVHPYERPISSGSISFDQGDPSLYPITQPIPKLSETIQTTGEARYLDDLSFAEEELSAAFVLSTVGNAVLTSIDPSAALALPGVVRFFSAASLFKDGFCNSVTEHEELFVTKQVLYCGQALGMVVATTEDIARAAAKLVRVEYSEEKQPILTIDDALKASSFFPDTKRTLKIGDVSSALAAADVIIEGETGLGHQYHFHLETQRAVAVPGEDNALTVYSSTQNPSLIQQVVSTAVNEPQYKVTVVVHRVGGAYGSKINRSAPTAMAAAIAAKSLGRPVRLVLNLSTNMQMVGGRSPYHCTYKIAATNSGKILGIFLRVLNNHGAHFDVDYPDLGSFLIAIDNVYKVPNWDVEALCVKTNLPSTTWIRGPGLVEAIFVMETMVEHVASAVSLPPALVKRANFYSPGDITPVGQSLTFCNITEIFDNLLASSEFEKRSAEVAAFNSSSRWVKRGISAVPIKYCIAWQGCSFNALVNIFPDGSVKINQSGCEIGQGLHVKVAQTAAMVLGALAKGGCPMERVHVGLTTTDVANNSTSTGGSVTSELCSMAVKDACALLVERIRPISSLLRNQRSGDLPTWQELIGAAVDAGVDLQSRSRVFPSDSGHGPFQYLSFGVGVTEAEVDLLTGDTRLLRCDLLLDSGKSLNPAIDIGQMQGAYMMGIGNFLTEEFLYDSSTGKLLSDSTWEYKPPSHKDIPCDFRASLLANSSSPYGFLRSKASGEPPYAMASSALFAVRLALASGHLAIQKMLPGAEESGGSKPWIPLPSPATVERVSLTASVPRALLTIS